MAIQLKRKGGASPTKRTRAPKAKNKLAPRVARTRNGGTMTEAQFFQKLRGALRSAFRWWKPMSMALDNSKRVHKGLNKKLKYEYQCALCTVYYARTSVEIDHIVPCGTLRSFEDVASFIERLTPEDPKAFQVLCKACHLKKTNEERGK
jgi:hypothetical protein